MPDAIIGTIAVCQDCLHAHANGEFSPDRPADLPEPLSRVEPPFSVTAGIVDDEHSEFCTRDTNPYGECDCESLGFRTSRCDGCGDTHHGDRYAMTLWRNGDAAEPCRWFAMCDRPATTAVSHPILGNVPTCDRCATKAVPAVNPTTGFVVMHLCDEECGNDSHPRDGREVPEDGAPAQSTLI